MKINSCTPNFKGRFYITTDSHTRTPMLAGVLSEISKEAKSYPNPQFYLDGGDFGGESVPYEVVRGVFKNFRKKNPNIPIIFNMGNTEIIDVLLHPKSVDTLFRPLKKSGIKLVSLSMIDTLKANNIKQDYLIPYAVINDVHNGKKEKILLTGFCEFDLKSAKNLAYPKSDLSDMKRLLKDEFLPVFKKEKPDKTILLIHSMTDKTNELLDYAEELGIDNIALVAGGHPHTIEDYSRRNTRILYPPVQGKGAYMVENSPNGIYFHKISRNPKNGYDYTVIKGNPDIIDNTDIYHSIMPTKDFLKILNNPLTKDLYKPILTAPFGLKFRNRYDFEYSEPTELGTFMANAYRDQSGADIGLFLSMDAREAAPPKGYKISKYNIADMLSVDKKLYKYEGLNADELKSLLEISLKNQHNGITNKNFIEYSDNLKIARYTNVTEDEPKIAQIYIKKDGEFTPLLDENQKRLTDEKFSVTTCSFVAKGPSRAELKPFQNYSSHLVEGISERETLIKEYQKYINEGVTKFSAAQIENRRKK